MKVWKYTQYALFVISFGAMLGSMLLLELDALGSDAHNIADAAHTVRLYYNSLITFFVTPTEEWRLNILKGIFWASFLSGGLIALLRGDIRGRRPNG